MTVWAFLFEILPKFLYNTSVVRKPDAFGSSDSGLQTPCKACPRGHKIPPIYWLEGMNILNKSAIRFDSV